MQIKNSFKIITLFILALVAVSCEKVVKVDVPDAETLLVVDAWVNNKPGTQTIRLTTTAPIFDGNRTPAADGAIVSLRDLTNGKVYPFTENTGTGNYVFTPAANDTLCVLGHQYELSVAYKGNSYTAVSTLNRTTIVDTVGFEDISSSGSGGPNNGATGEKKYGVWLFGKDIPARRDYYWIKSFRNGVFFNQPTAINVSEDAGGGESTDGLCFIPPNAFFNVIPFDDGLLINDVYTVEIHSLNKESLDYLIQLKTQINNSQSGMFAVTPENLKTNIKPANANAPRALGWFNMAMVSSKSFVCKDISAESVYLGGYYCP